MVSSNNLSGAGGGIPAALQIFYSTNLLQSSEFIKDNLDFKKYVNNVEYLITGEGAYDHQSDFGKGIESFNAFVQLKCRASISGLWKNNRWEYSKTSNVCIPN